MDSPVVGFHRLLALEPVGLGRRVLERENSLMDIAAKYIEEDEYRDSSGEEGAASQESEPSRSTGGKCSNGVGYARVGRSREYNTDLNNRVAASNGKEVVVNIVGDSENEELGNTGELLQNELDVGGLLGSAVAGRLPESAENGLIDHTVELDAENRVGKQGAHNGDSVNLTMEGDCRVESEDGKMPTDLSEKENKEGQEEEAGIRHGSASYGDSESRKAPNGNQVGLFVEAGDPLPGSTSRRRRGRPLKQSAQKSGIQTSPITPKLEEPRAVRSNRGIKRWFPGDESEDSLPKRIRVRSIASVCGSTTQPIKGDDFCLEEGLKTVSAKKRGRPRKSDIHHQQPPQDENQEGEQIPLSSGKRKMGLESESSKRCCNGRNTSATSLSQKNPIYVCNVEGCKKRFTEGAALYTHARIHGDRPYMCHYSGCIKSFSERSKLKRHFLIHTGEKPFLCHFEGCGKAFSLDFNLRSHMKTHTGDYNECPYAGCEKRYCQEYKLRAHITKEHSKPARGVRKLATTGTDTVGSHIQDITVMKKREMLAVIAIQRTKVEETREGRVNRIAELEQEREREANELALIEQDLEKLERKQKQLEEGQVGSPATSVSLAEEEEDVDEEEEEDDMELSNATVGQTSSSSEQQSHLSNLPLEYMGEGNDVVMFAHKHPTADQGARLVKALELRLDSQPEPITSLTPLLWLKGAPPRQGHLGEQPGLRPLHRSQRPVQQMSELQMYAKSPRALPGTNNSDIGVRNMHEQQKGTTRDGLSRGEGTDSEIEKTDGFDGHLGRVDQVVEQLKGKADNDLPRGDGGAAQLDRITGKCDVDFQNHESRNEDMDQGFEQLEKEETKLQNHKSEAGEQLSSGGQVFVSMNPVLLSMDHGFSPTNARFLASSEGYSSMVPCSTVEQMQQEVDDSKALEEAAAAHDFVTKEQSHATNEVLQSRDCALSNGGSFSEQNMEQSFESSAAQLFTYQEQPCLVD